MPTGELIGYVGLRRPSSVVVVRRGRRPRSSNIFFSETSGPIKIKFHMEPPWDRGMKVYSNGPGHTTKMAAMPIYGKNLKKSSSLELKGRWPLNLVCSIKDVCWSHLCITTEVYKSLLCRVYHLLTQIKQKNQQVIDLVFAVQTITLRYPKNALLAWALIGKMTFFPSFIKI